MCSSIQMELVPGRKTVQSPCVSKTVSWFPASINADLDCDRQEAGNPFESGPSLSTISLHFTSHLVMFSVSAKKSIGELKDPKLEFVCLAFARLTHRQWWRAYWEVSALKLVWRWLISCGMDGKLTAAQCGAKCFGLCRCA